MDNSSLSRTDRLLLWSPLAYSVVFLGEFAIALVCIGIYQLVRGAIGFDSSVGGLFFALITGTLIVLWVMGLSELRHRARRRKYAPLVAPFLAALDQTLGPRRP